MDKFYKYLTVSADDIDCGLEILNAGYYESAANITYPDKKHPSDHYFNWETGRVLQEYQMIYVSGGSGIYHSRHRGDIVVKPGSVRSNIENEISPRHIAKELNISYSRFRKIFKEYTGIAPIQYHIQLKIERAKELSAIHTKPIKEISYELNFESYNYFSALLKEKTGISPIEFRRSMAMAVQIR